MTCHRDTGRWGGNNAKINRRRNQLLSTETMNLECLVWFDILSLIVETVYKFFFII